jgi:uncharacterized protein
MSAENVEVVRRSWEAWGAGDAAAALACFDPAVEWEPAADEPDARTAHGHEGVMELVRSWNETFEDFTGRPLEFIDAGNTVIVPMSFSGRMRGTQSEVELKETQVYTLHDGLIVSLREYRTKEEALAALRLDE